LRRARPEGQIALDHLDERAVRQGVFASLSSRPASKTASTPLRHAPAMRTAHWARAVSIMPVIAVTPR
jgi:hypothetical protein